MPPDADTVTETVYEGRFLRMKRRGRYEFAARVNATGVVSIVAEHDDGRIVLIQQHRPPADADVLELPAGLVGDGDGDESLLDAARRELEEETGYRAASWKQLVTGLSSAGLTDEAVTVFHATGLTRTGTGGGVGSESIRVHEVQLDDVPRWLEQRMAEGLKVDLKLQAGVYHALVDRAGRAT